MALTKANIHTEIRTLFNEAAAGFFDNTDVNNWIDQAAIDISSKALCCEDGSQELTLVEGILEYARPTGIIKVISCRFENKGLYRIEPKQIGHLGSTTSGPPQFFYEFAKKIGIYPVCDAASATKKVGVLGAKEVDSIVDATFPDEYQPYAILYGLYRGLLKDKMYANANNVLTMYLNNLLFHRQDLQERGQDSRDMMKLADRTVTVKD